MLALAGVLGAVLGARAMAHSDAERQRLASHLSAAEIASVLKLAIRREEDLTISTSAFVASNPNVTPAAFDRWIESVRAIQRYPELQNIGLLKLVQASQLTAFEAREASDPIRPLGPRSVSPAGDFQILPAGRRPHYCLADAGMASDAADYVPEGLDYCEVIRNMITTRDSGLTGYAPIAEAGTTGLGVGTPVYRTGVTPSTVQGRRRAFLGWLGERIFERLLRRLPQPRGGMRRQRLPHARQSVDQRAAVRHAREVRVDRPPRDHSLRHRGGPTGGLELQRAGGDLSEDVSRLSAAHRRRANHRGRLARSGMPVRGLVSTTAARDLRQRTQRT